MGYVLLFLFFLLSNSSEHFLMKRTTVGDKIGLEFSGHINWEESVFPFRLHRKSRNNFSLMMDVRVALYR